MSIIFSNEETSITVEVEDIRIIERKSIILLSKEEEYIIPETFFPNMFPVMETYSNVNTGITVFQLKKIINDSNSQTSSSTLEG